MRFWAAALAVSLFTAPAAAQTEPVAIADAFLQAFLAGDAAAIRNHRTADAAFAFGDVGGPMAGIEEEISHRPEWKTCSVGPLALSSEPVASNLLNLPSVRSGEARLVDGSLSCRTPAGAIKTTSIKLVVAHGKVAVFAF